MSVVNLTEAEVEQLLSWPLVNDAVEQALSAITEIRTGDSQPTANQPARIFTPVGNGKGLKIEIIYRFDVEKGMKIRFCCRCVGNDARIHWQLPLETYGSRRCREYPNIQYAGLQIGYVIQRQQESESTQTEYHREYQHIQ